MIFVNDVKAMMQRTQIILCYNVQLLKIWESIFFSEINDNLSIMIYLLISLDYLRLIKFNYWLEIMVFILMKISVLILILMSRNIEGIWYILYIGGQYILNSYEHYLHLWSCVYFEINCCILNVFICAKIIFMQLYPKHLMYTLRYRQGDIAAQHYVMKYKSQSKWTSWLLNVDKSNKN
jgi:hypothetical protein